MANAAADKFVKTKGKDSYCEQLPNAIDELSWNVDPHYYDVCWNTFAACATPRLKQYFDEHPTVRFRFQLMTALKEETSHATMMHNWAANVSRNVVATPYNPVDDFLQQQPQHGLALVQAKSIFDALYTKPQDGNDRDACGQYAIALFKTLDQAHPSHCRNALPLPINWLENTRS